MSKKNIRYKRPQRRRFSLTWLLGATFIVACAYIAFGGDLSGISHWVQRFEFEPPVSSNRTLTGYASVRDGDSLVINGESIRLEGIDAFELTQNCGPVACGLEARSELQRLVLGGPVTCEDVGRDTYDRVLALCHNAAGVDINEALVLSGYAIAYLYYTPRYRKAQAQARNARRGAWAHDFVEPYEYRRARR